MTKQTLLSTLQLPNKRESLKTLSQTMGKSENWLYDLFRKSEPKDTITNALAQKIIKFYKLETAEQPQPTIQLKKIDDTWWLHQDGVKKIGYDSIDRFLQVLGEHLTLTLDQTQKKALDKALLFV